MQRTGAVMQWLLGAFLAVFAVTAAAQQSFPTRPIRIIVPFSPGGAVTVLARMVGEKLTEKWGQPVIIENRPGANTIIGAEAVAKSPADGYTLLLVASDHVIVPSLYSTPFDAIKDFTPVATIARGDYLLVINPDIPVNNVKELIALAKANPGKLNFASSANGGSSHLAGEYFNILAGTKMQHIPYKGAAQALADVLGGQVQISFTSPASAIALINGGRLKPLAIIGESRLAILPNVPTFDEAGLPGLDVRNWYGIVAPAGTPKDVVDKLSSAISAIVAEPEFREKLSAQGTLPFISTPDAMGAMMKADMAKFASIIKSANVKVD